MEKAAGDEELISLLVSIKQRLRHISVQIYRIRRILEKKLGTL